MKKKSLLIWILIFSLLLIGCGNSNGNNDKNTNSNTNSNTIEGHYTLGDTFIFSGLELSFGEKTLFGKIDNAYSEHHDKNVVVVPIMITNKDTEPNKLSMFDYSVYNHNGDEVETVGASFIDDNVEYTGEIESGKTVEAYIHFLYEGDGDYFIEFWDWINEPIMVKLTIKST